MSIEEIKAEHSGQHVEEFDAGEGMVDVIVWETEADSVDDDGSQAIARYHIPA